MFITATDYPIRLDKHNFSAAETNHRFTPSHSIVECASFHTCKFPFSCKTVFRLPRQSECCIHRDAIKCKLLPQYFVSTVSYLSYLMHMEVFCTRSVTVSIFSETIFIQYDVCRNLFLYNRTYTTLLPSPVLPGRLSGHMNLGCPVLPTMTTAKLARHKSLTGWRVQLP